MAAAYFAALLAFSIWGVSVGWQSLNLPGNEFRQAQTALSSYYIQQDHNFSLAYPTPVLGKPWSVPMEFPLYQWTVVLLSNSTGLELTKSGRLVSIGCFYLALPFLYLLLGRLGLPWSRRLVALGLVLCCPLHIYYARSFMIETMALLLALAFLWSYLLAVERRHGGWLFFASLAGIGAGLVKVTTFLYILMPAFCWIVRWLWQARPGTREGGWRTLASLAAWALTGVTLPCLVAKWWISHADAIKALNPLAAFLRAETLNSYLFGEGVRFSGELWQHHFAILFREIAAGWTLTGAGLLALSFGRRWWSWLVLLVGSFFAVQLIFPVLYAWHDYYYMANAFALMLALGLVLCGVLESRLPRLLAWVLVLVVTGGQVGLYFDALYPMQRYFSPGGGYLTRTLTAVTDPDDVLVIAGNDWSSITPYFARRRALMIRNGMEYDQSYFRPAFQRLQGERVGALVLHGLQQSNRPLIALAVRIFGLDPRPVYTSEGAAIYMLPSRRLAAIPVLKSMRQDNPLELMSESLADENALRQHEVETEMLPAWYHRLFADMSPAPWKYYSDVGASRNSYEGREYYWAHPVTRLWFRVPAGRRHISVEVGLIPQAYDEKVLWDDRTDGIELAISEEPAGGAPRPLFSQLLEPRDKPADRGIKTLECTAEFAADSVVQIAVLPGPRGSAARDWAVLGRIEIK